MTSVPYKRVTRYDGGWRRSRNVPFPGPSSHPATTTFLHRSLPPALAFRDSP